MENLDPPLPLQIKDGKMERFCPSCGFILDLGGKGICCSIFILSKIVVKLNFATPLDFKLPKSLRILQLLFSKSY